MAKTYKLWITIEEHDTETDTYEDLNLGIIPRSVGCFSSLELAEEHMETLGDIHMNDGDVPIEKQ